MYPISLHLDKQNLAIVGTKAGVKRRLENLQKAYPDIKPQLFEDSLPNFWQIRKLSCLMIVDTSDEVGIKLYRKAKKYNILVNFEDHPDYCDFYFCAFFKRGDLGLSISTNGKSPALGVTLRKKLEELLPEKWSDRLEEVSKKRMAWKAEGNRLGEVNKLSKQYIAEQNWLEELDIKQKKKWYQR